MRNEFESLVVERRSGIYDVICQDEHKQIFLLEMQADNYDKLLERLQFYAYQLYISAVEKGDYGFDKLRPIYCICIVKDTIIKSP